MKKLLSLALCFLTVFSAIVPVFAADTVTADTSEATGLTSLPTGTTPALIATYNDDGTAVIGRSPDFYTEPDVEGLSIISTGKARLGATTLALNTAYGMKINVSKTGKYAFYFQFGNAGGDASRLNCTVSILVNGVDTGADAVYAVHNTPNYYGPVYINLDAGDNTVAVMQEEGASLYYTGFHYAFVSKAELGYVTSGMRNAGYHYEIVSDGVRDSNYTDQVTSFTGPNPNLVIEPALASPFVDTNSNRYGMVQLTKDYTYTLPFTVDETGKYEIYLVFRNRYAGAGIPVEIFVDGEDVGYQFTSTRNAHTFAGPLSLGLVAGTHTVSVKQNGDGVLFYAGFGYKKVGEYIPEEPDTDVEGGDADGIYTGDIAVLPNTNATVPGDALGQPNVNAINPVDAPAANMGEVSASAPAASVAAPAPKQPYVPARKPAAPGRPGNHVSTPARPA